MSDRVGGVKRCCPGAAIVCLLPRGDLMMDGQLTAYREDTSEKEEVRKR